ncbi:DNA repair protein RadC [Polynucleobacter sp.]|uniref:RadC family protein n=1 Tax=Polynucleobacter sp. TaxID=2029855 RepID=UPI002732A096|nr:DNA repair protein RadC [Polynucleobacter sp.]MDP3121903.1 DNA repair protein RadC [Polynucleobacter sp.]
MNGRHSHRNIVARTTGGVHSPISEWPKGQQPREKLRLAGPEALSDAELLAIFLRVGVKGKTAVTLAQDLLGTFGSLPRLLNSSAEEITRCYGMGISKWAQIQAAYELVKRSLEHELMHDSVLGSPAQMRELIQAKIGHLPHEVFLCLHLDSKNRLIECQELFRGSVAQTAIYPREIVKEALIRNSSALIVAHNHPSGDPYPSKKDIELTRTLQQALQWVAIGLLDHCIVSQSSFFSFVEAGIMDIDPN